MSTDLVWVHENDSCRVTAKKMTDVRPLFLLLTHVARYLAAKQLGYYLLECCRYNTAVECRMPTGQRMRHGSTGGNHN